MANDYYTRGFKSDRHRGVPLGTLWLNNGEVTGDVTLQNFFKEYDPIGKVDVLQDIIGLLEREKDACIRDCKKYFKEKSKKTKTDVDSEIV